MPFGVWGDRVGAQGTGGGYSPQSVLANSSPFSAQSQFVSGGGNTAYYGPGQSAVQTRQFADVGKVQLNLLDPLSQYRADNPVPIDPAPAPSGPLGGIAHYYDPATPGGLFSGLLGAVGQTVGGIAGQGQAGSQIGQVLGKTIEAPLGIIGGVGIPFVAPVIDQANSAIEQNSPYILRDTLKIPTNLGGAFQSLLNVVGLAGRAVERTYVGLFRNGETDLPPDIQARVDSGELTHDQALDELTVSHRGFTNDPLQNTVFEILTDPVNWLSLGVGTVGAAVRGTEAVGMAFGGAVRAAGEGSALAQLAEAGANAGEVGRLAAAAKESAPIVGRIAGRDTLAQMRSAIDDSGATLHLTMAERLGMSALGPVSSETAQGVIKVGDAILRATNPINFFSGSKAGQRSMQLLRTASASGVYAALKPLVVNDILKTSDAITSDGADRILKAIGSWGGNAMQEVGANEMANDAVRSNAIPKFGSLNSTEAVRAQLAGGAWDTNIGKYVETHVEKTKDLTIGTLPYQQMYDQTIQKWAAILGTSPERVAAKVKSVSQDLAIAIHGAYYYTKGMDLHGPVKTAMAAAEAAGTLPAHIKSDLVTMISPRTLTQSRLGPIQAALKSGNLEDLRTEIEKYDDFNWANRTSLPDSDLKEAVQNWVDTNGSNLTREINLRDPLTHDFLPGVPQELQDWLHDGEGNVYSLGEKIPGNAPLEAQWRVTRNAKGTMINANPWLDFMSETGEPVKRLNTFQAMRMAATRSIRQERIVWQQRRAFITDMAHASESHGVDIPPKLSERIFQSLMYEAQDRYLMPRGMEPREMMDAVHGVLDEVKKNNSQWDNIGGQITERQVVLGFLRAMQGDVGLVGVTQKITGGVKAYAPGAVHNYWGRISERLYPLMRFTLNPVFQAMEFTEPYVLNTMRGIGLPLRRDSAGFAQALASRNAIEQLIRRSDTPGGMLEETAEALALGSYQKAEAASQFGRRTFFGGLSNRLGMRGGNKLLKEAAAGQEARRLVGDNLYAAFKQIKGDQFEAFWGDMQTQFGTSNRADIAERWLSQNLNLQDADGFRVGLVTDLMNHKNIGQDFRISKDGRPGAYTFKDVEELLDNTRKYAGDEPRSARGLKPGDALVEDLKNMTNAQWHAETEKAWSTPRVGRINKSSADDIYRVANFPGVTKWWKGYRDTMLRGVTGTDTAYTRLARDNEIKAVKTLVRGWARNMDMTEHEFLALHSDDIPKYVEDIKTAIVSPDALTDIRGDVAHQMLKAGGPQIEPASMIKWTHEAGEAHPLDAAIDDAASKSGNYLYGVPSKLRYAQTTAGEDDTLMRYGTPLYEDPLHSLDRTWEDGPLVRIGKGTLDTYDSGDGTHQLNNTVHVNAEHQIEVLTKDGWKPWDQVSNVMRQQEGPAVDPAVEAIYNALPPQPVAGLAEKEAAQVGAETGEPGLKAAMTEAERSDLARYTMDGYETVNKYARGHGIDGNYTEAELDEVMARLDRAIQKGQLREPAGLWRGINLVDWKTAVHGQPDIDYRGLTVGQTFRDAGYTSMSHDRGVAMDFAGTERYGVILHYDLPAGTHVNLTGNKLESEIIGGRGREYEVIRVHPAADGFREIWVRPVADEVVPGVQHLAYGDIPTAQRNAHLLVSDAMHDPEGLRAMAAQAGGDAPARAEQAIAEAKTAGPAKEVQAYGDRTFGPTTPASALSDINEVMTPEQTRAAFGKFADFRGRLQHLLETSHPRDPYTDMAIPSQVMFNNDTRIIASLAATLPSMGARRGLNHLFQLMNDMWNGGLGRIAEKGVGATASPADRLDHQITTIATRDASHPIPMPWMLAQTHDASDTLLGNTTRAATGRTQTLQPIIADDAAAEGAGYLTKGTLKQLVEEHGLDAGNGLVRLTSADGTERLIDPETLDVVTPGAGPQAIRAPSQPPIPLAEGFEPVKSLGGTTGALQVRDPATGRLYVEKRGNSEAHIIDEHHADSVYEAMGVPVPRQELLDQNGAVKRANMIEGMTPLSDYLRTATPEEQDAMLAQVQQHFALDSLLANWDVTGLVGDNIGIKDGIAYRVDNGGSLRFRAQGQPKGGAFGEHVGELDSLRDPNLNRWGARVFGSITDPEIRRQVLDLADNRERILAALPESLRPVISARLDDMLDQTRDIVPAVSRPEVRVPGYQTLTPYDHEHMVGFYNDLAQQMSAAGTGGIKEWTAGDAAALVGRMKEMQGRPEGTVLDAKELDRLTHDIPVDAYPKPGEPNYDLTPILQMLNQKRNAPQLHMVMSAVSTDLAREIRDRFGVVVDGADDTGIGMFDSVAQRQLPLQLVDRPEQVPLIGGIASYATRTPEMALFSHDRTAEEIAQTGDDFHAYTPRLSLVLPENRYPRVTEKVAKALGARLPVARDATARIMPDGSGLVQIIDPGAVFPRLANGEVDYDLLNKQITETLQAIPDSPDEGLDWSIDYGTRHAVGPPKEADGTYNWEAYGDAVHAQLQAAGSTAGREDLDAVRTTAERSLRDNTREVSPANFRRIENGDLPTHELEDRRGGQVLGTTTPGGVTSSLIRGFGAADPLTGLHELVHMFSLAGMGGSLREAVSQSWGARVTAVEQHAQMLEERAAQATNQAYRTKLLNDATAARAGIGTTDPEVWGKAQEEHLVQTLFAWIDRGVPESPDMRQVSDHFRNWIEVTRKDMRQRGMPPVEVSPAMEAAFNRMTQRPAAATVEYSVEQQAQRMAAIQVVKASWDEAHATQFYKHDRSMVERSINHPYIGLYPASYMWGKVLPEMVRFLALRPFGLETPFLAWNVLRQVSDSVRAQGETDPHFKQFLADNKEAFLLASMFFPSLPQDTPANVSLPIRRIAEQGLTNQMKYATGNGANVKDIDYAKGAQDAMYYALGPAGSIKTASAMAASGGQLFRSVTGTMTPAEELKQQQQAAADAAGQSTEPVPLR